MVCAPTGSGKTVIAEYAVEMALASNKRCYYTTPLKALSNQKLFDLRRKYGDDRVGLLTGDQSLNRDASIVVMTTEVFRNMLYGTVLGDVSRNLRDVAFVILDECHYMNDSERGTVWEESIIYAPVDIQLVALSATVANAEELTTWIDETHGATALISSDFRPVPLRFHFFGERRIYPLLSPGGGVNGQLKSRFGKGRNRTRPMKSRRHSQFNTHPGDVLGTLSGRNMLPVIYFLFSRRGCEEAMKRASGIPLLSDQEHGKVLKAIEELTANNPNLKNHPHIEYLQEGMAVHHAGMLPSWKGVVEKLFQAGLLKAVFATETLAAGINMPARSTVISSLTKRADEGHRSLTASEFLQMSGRAGRRGMDEVGHVVVLHNVFEPVEDGARLAMASSDPLSSRFTPSYGMVLNLLERHTIEEAQELIERSFGQFVTNQQLEPMYVEKMQWEAELDKLKDPLCPDEIGDLDLYAKRLAAIRAKHKQLKQMEKGTGAPNRSPHGRSSRTKRKAVEAPTRPIDDSQVKEAIEAMKKEIAGLLEQAYAMPCHGCPVQKPCSNQTGRQDQLQKRIKEIDRRIMKETGKYWRTFQALANVLRLHGYLDGNKPTDLGRLAAGIRGTNELFLTEVALSGLFDQLSGPELAGLITALVQEEGRLHDMFKRKMSGPVEGALGEVKTIAKRVLRAQKDFDIEIPVEFSGHFSGITEMWAQGASWQHLRHATSYDEGDIVRALRRTLDLCRQYMRADGMPESVVEACRQCESLINRDEVKEDFS
ncbi:MAG: DEAD/DEAH box helicase [Candidatus Obscuribacterales bacterium]|nr:DEAD/DEAH box helicase [Candidatus Obscuribacterales bacterium]